MSRISKWFLPVLICGLLGLVGCSGSGGGGGKARGAEIELSGPKSITLDEGEIYNASVNVSGGATSVSDFDWTSSDDSIASIAGSGRIVTVQANSAGTATIDVAYQNERAGRISVTVAKAGECVTDSVEIQGPTALDVNGTASLYLSVSCQNGQQRVATNSVGWSSSASNILSVGNTGNIFGVADGAATITATYQNTFQDTHRVQVGEDEPDDKEVSSLSVKLASTNYAYPADFCPGKDIDYTVTATYSDGSKSDVTANVDVSSVSQAIDASQKGEVSAVSVGEANVQFLLDGITESISFVVNECGITYFFNKPDNWGAPKIYGFIEGGDPDVFGAWADAPTMTDDGDGWFKYFTTISDDNLRVIFRDDNRQTVNLERTRTGWCEVVPGNPQDDCNWLDSDPRAISVGESPYITFSPNGGTIFGATAVDLTFGGEGYVFCNYTTNGQQPGINSPVCSNSSDIENIGNGLSAGQSVTLQVCISDSETPYCESRTYTLSDGNASDAEFTWDNATVYFVLTDRFENGNTANDQSYNESDSILGRQLKSSPSSYENSGNRNLPDWGTFHGGDLKGLTNRLDYIASLGVNAIWLTSPLEQIHGWVQGQINGQNAFRHYPFHGYYPLDFTQLDKNMGTEDEFREFIDAAHARGIRVVMDVVVNHVGYPNLKDFDEFDVDVIDPISENTTTLLEDYHDYIHYDGAKVGNWEQWWGRDWIRLGIQGSGYDAGDDNDALTQGLVFLPDFKTESQDRITSLPTMYRNKQTNASLVPNGTVRDNLVEWLTQWVEDYGIDGFRADTVKHVEEATWVALKEAGVNSLRKWKQNNPSKKLDDLDFWMVGEVFDFNISDHIEGWRGEGRNGSINFFSEAGFDSVINFEFQRNAMSRGWGDNVCGVMDTYASYANMLNTTPYRNTLSYISSHDTDIFWNGNTQRQKNIGTVLLMVPGGAQIYYGDEYGRDGYQTGDVLLNTRTDMDFNTRDDVRQHWMKVGQFRRDHPSVGGGSHERIYPSSGCGFKRTRGDDSVVVAMGATGNVSIDVAGAFANGTLVRNAYDGTTATVNNGSVSFSAGPNGVVLVERAD